MYKCDSCGKTTSPGEKQNKVLLKMRQKTYYNPIKDYRGKIMTDTNRKPKLKETHGHEIVTEHNYCDKCYA